MHQTRSDAPQQGKKSKLPSWMKKIIQPNGGGKDVVYSQAQAPQQHEQHKKHSTPPHKIKRVVSQPYSAHSVHSAYSVSSSMRPMFHRDPSPTAGNDDDDDDDPPLIDQTLLQPVPAPAPAPRRKHDPPDGPAQADHASISPLLSYYSTSAKSSTFSDTHSVQSTRPTLVSARTLDTNSSTVAIPPASIVDRARPTHINGGASVNSSAVSFNNGTTSLRLPARRNSSHTVNSVVTLKS